MFNSKAGFVFLVSFKQGSGEGCAVGRGNLWLQHFSSEVPGKETLPWNGSSVSNKQSISHFSVELWDPFNYLKIYIFLNICPPKNVAQRHSSRERKRKKKSLIRIAPSWKHWNCLKLPQTKTSMIMLRKFCHRREMKCVLNKLINKMSYVINVCECYVCC